MSHNEDGDLNLETMGDVKKALHDIHERTKDLRDRGDLDTQIKALASDLTTCTQKITELESASSSRAWQGAEGEGEMRAYVADDDQIKRGARGGHVVNGIVMRGYNDDELGWVPGLLDEDPKCDWQERAQDLVDQASLVHVMRGGRDQSMRESAPKSIAQLRRHFRNAPDGIRRIFGDGSNIGGEWIPDVHLPTLERDMVAARRTESLFQAMPMSDKEIRIPFLTTGLQMYKKGAPIVDDPGRYEKSSAATDKLSITAQGFVVYCQVDEDASEDSIIDSQAILRQLLVEAETDGCEDAIFNSDSAGTHQDTGIATWNPRSRWPNIVPSADHRTSWLGLRAAAKDRSAETDHNALQSVDGFRQARGKLDSPHGVGGDLVCCTSPEYYLKMVDFDEVLTFEKFGSQATVLNGQLAALFGIPIIVSEFVTADMASTGLYTGSGSTTSMLLLNRARWKMGVRRGQVVEIDKDITRGIFHMVLTVRKVFWDLDFQTSKKNVHNSFNLTTT